MLPTPPISAATSSIEAFIDPAAIEALLSLWLSDASERSYVARCILESGPAHHRGSNFILLALLGQAASQLPEAGAREATSAETEQGAQVPMRLPPHLAGKTDDRFFPLKMSTHYLRQLAGGDENRLAAMIDCLTDGPPQHALGNALMVNLLERILDGQQKAPR